MGALDFIFYTLAMLIGAIVIIGVVCTIWDTKKLEDENECLRKQVQSLKTRYIKREYKKSKKVEEK